jgi:predicted methyltransferase
MAITLPLLIWAAMPSETAAQGEDQNRDAWQRVPDILKAMGVKEGSKVADVGAGGGYFTKHLARAVGPQGRVFAVDIDADALNKLRRLVKEEKLNNVEVVRGDTDNPKLPEAALDAIVILNAYHEMTEYTSMLDHMFRALKPGGRLVISEPISEERRGAFRAEQVEHHDISIGYVLAELERAGFVIIEAHDPFITTPYNVVFWLLAGRRPALDEPSAH